MSSGILHTGRKGDQIIHCLQLSPSHKQGCQTFPCGLHWLFLDSGSDMIQYRAVTEGRRECKTVQDTACYLCQINGKCWYLHSTQPTKAGRQERDGKVHIFLEIIMIFFNMFFIFNESIFRTTYIHTQKKTEIMQTPPKKGNDISY